MVESEQKREIASAIPGVARNVEKRPTEENVRRFLVRALTKGLEMEGLSFTRGAAEFLVDAAYREIGGSDDRVDASFSAVVAAAESPASSSTRPG